MARGREPLRSIDQQILDKEQEIKDIVATLNKAREELEELRTKKRQGEVDELLSLLEKSGKSVDDVKKWMTGEYAVRRPSGRRI